MAEAVLLPVAEAILRNLGSPLRQEIGLLSGLQKELGKLSRTVSTIKAVLLDAEKQYSSNNQARVWLEMLKDALYDADDLLDDFATEASRRQRMAGNKLTKEVRLFFSSSNKLAYSINMAHKIKDIREKLDHIATDRRFHLSENLVEPSSVEVSWRETHSSAPEVVIGREDDKKAILNLLLSDHGEASVAVIPIVGFGGTGKTTLAQLVYNDPMVQNQFDPKLWVCVSDTFDVQLILKKMVESVTEEKPGDVAMETLKKKLCDRINGRKYLLVLDDIWNEDRQKWLDLSNLVIGGARGSRIILTTRLRRVAEVTSLVSPYELGGLSDTDSWDLFQKMAFEQGQAPNKDLEAMGKDIVAKCAGLPLVIRTIGSFLYRKEEVQWQSFKDMELSKLDPETDILGTLKLSYNHLPSYLKQCFAYCSLFPKDYKIHVPTLISYWKAQGYICLKNQGRTSENLGLSSFNYLLQRSFFQEVKENKYGDIEYCKMHDFMHDLAVLVAGEESILVDPNRVTTTEKCRHLSLCGNLISQWQPEASLMKARTFTFLSAHGLSLSERYVDNSSHAIIRRLRCLRVLHLRSCYMNKVPCSIHELKHLRHLDLSWNRSLEELPNCITRLLNLQVLNVDECRRIKQLPRDTMKLVNLMHLGVKGCAGLTQMPRGLGQLTSLEVLSRFVLSKQGFRFNGSSGLNELHGLNNLSGELEIVYLRYVKDPRTECQAVNLKGKPLLRVLTLSWEWCCRGRQTMYYGGVYEVDDISSQEMTMEALEPHTNLKELNIICYGGVEFPRWISSLTNLVKIKFFNCKNCKSLPPLDELPSLQDLEVDELKDLEYMDIKGGGVDSNTSSLTFFPSLKRLILRRCPSLKGWRRRTLTDASGNTTPPTSSSLLDERFACLSKVSIFFCPNLTWIPQLPSLEDLTLSASNTTLLSEHLLVKPPTSSTSPTSTLSPLQRLFIQGIEDCGFLKEEMMRNLANLKSLSFSCCRNTRALSPWIQHLTSLEDLSVWDTEEMYLLEDEDEDNTQWQQLMNLRCVIFRWCSKLKSLPKWLQHVSPLEQLTISDCRDLMGSPECLANLTSLQHLEVIKCRGLSERCRSNKGADWSYVSHIPNIYIDYEWVQKNGCYVLS